MTDISGERSRLWGKKVKRSNRKKRKGREAEREGGKTVREELCPQRYNIKRHDKKKK